MLKVSTPLDRINDGQRLKVPTGHNWLGERKRLNFINLRLDPNNRAALQAAQSAADVPLAKEPGQIVSKGDQHCLWLGPDEWLLMGGKDPDQAGQLQSALKRHHSSVVDQSDNYVALRLAGLDTRKILSKLIPYDLHPDNFGPGQVLSSQAAKANVIACCFDVDGHSVFDLIVRRSFSAYMWNYLVDAGREFDLKNAKRFEGM